MLRKIVIVVVLIPLAVVIVAFAVANRQVVTISFDPFASANPAYAASLPLFVVIFLLVILGVVIGGVAAWLRQHKWRASARRAEAQNRELTIELAQLRRRMEQSDRPDTASRADSVRLLGRSPVQ